MGIAEIRRKTTTPQNCVVRYPTPLVFRAPPPPPPVEVRARDCPDGSTPYRRVTSSAKSHAVAPARQHDLVEKTYNVS